jgi:two-component system, LytTR family, response regulator AlgR
MKPLTDLRVLIVDDEPLARARLKALLQKVAPGLTVQAEVGDAGAALAWLESRPGQTDVIFLDIQMPGPDGLRLADKLRDWPHPLQTVFVTAHAEHALKAFELEACDYLTKPVRAERLLQALARCARQQPELSMPAPTNEAGSVVVQDRGRLVKVPLHEVLYFKAELKYVTLRTAQHSWILDESLTELESRMGDRFIRVHRNALVARDAMVVLERRDGHDPGEAGEGWAVQVKDTGEWLSVSRRQAPLVREALTRA